MVVRMCVVLALLGMILPLSRSSGLAAQGTVSGQVVEAGTMRPMAGAQVSIVEAGVGGLANAQGRYLIVGVPAGQVTVRAQSIGFATEEQVVTVPDGGTVSADFTLRTEALGLDEIVVTGTAGGQRRRAIGNVVTSLDIAARLEREEPVSIQQMLSGQVAGANVRIGGGNVGSGGTIRIRGMSTLALNSEPIVYVDGIRVDGGQTSSGTGRGDKNISRLNDINPQDIASIEIIKGPAAATLYGTEATNGVIQIITKRGQTSSPRLTVSIRQGVNWLSHPEEVFPENWTLEDGQVIRQDLVAEAAAEGSPLFRHGRIQNYSANLSGGQGPFNYYFSLGYEDEVGHVYTNDLQRLRLRSNLGLSITDDLEVSTEVGVVRSDLSYQPDAGTNISRAIIRGLPSTRNTEFRGFDAMPPEALYQIQNTEELNRGTASTTVTHRPTTWFTQRLIAGLDWSDTKGVVFQPRLPEESPRWYGSSSVGEKELSNARKLIQTLDYSATASFDLSPTWTSATTVGAQFFSNETSISGAEGRDMPTPSVSTVSAAAIRTSSETFVENKTLGAFVQQTIGWKDQLFLTAAVRADANSAFGEEFNEAYYPKFSGTWTISDAGFWNVDFAESVRIRGAWGRSGQQPEAFAALRTYSPATGPGDLPTLTPGNVGNPALKPETGTEFEIGVDASFLQGRVTTEFTHYRQSTNDLIIAERVAPSAGFPGTRFVNLGQVDNQGYEIGLTVTPISSESTELDLTFSAGHNENTLVDLAGREVQADTRGRWHHIEGEPLGVMGTKRIATAEWGPDNTLVNVTCQGSAEQDFAPMPCNEAPFHLLGSGEPSWTGSFGQRLTLGSGLTLSANWVFAFDTWKYSTDEWAREQRLQTTEMAVMRQQGLGDPVEQASLITPDVEHPFFERDDHVRLREISASYVLPSDWVQGWGISRAAITLSGRNLFYAYVHPSFRYGDPESKSYRNAPWPAWEQARLPGPQSFVTSFQVTF